ncbi:MAG: hypothetical protein WCJ55_13090 [Chloroflexales bacterium]
MLTWQELWIYLRLLLRWSPLIIVAIALSSGTAWFLSRSQPNFYQARATLMVGNNFESSSPNTFAVDLSNSLARFYEVLLHREVILDPVAKQLKLDFPANMINSMLSVSINPQANLLEISITDSSPERAAALANTLGERLIAYSPNSPEKVAAQQAEVDRQITETQATIADTDRKLEELRTRQRQLNAAIDLRENQDQIDQLEKARGKAQDGYNQLLLLRNNSAANTLSFFERASLPMAPLPQKRSLIVGGAGMGGLLIAVVAVMLLDRIDNRWRSGSDLQQRIGITHLGSINHADWRPDIPSGPHYQRAVRETHTQIALMASDEPLRLLLVSSPHPSESRSIYAVDLAHVYGQAGHRVLLVDAELSRSHIGKILRVHEQDESGSATAESAIERWSSDSPHSYHVPAELWMRLRTTSMANVMLLPSQVDSDDMSILVPSLHWSKLVDALRNCADVVIFDGPSALTGADAALLAPLVDGVVLVLSPHVDSRSEVEKTKQWIQRSGGSKLLGAVTVSDAPPTSAPRKPRRLPAIDLSIGTEGLTITFPTREHRPPQMEDVRRRESAPQTVAHRSHTEETSVIITPPPPTVIITPPPIMASGMSTDSGTGASRRRPIVRSAGMRRRRSTAGYTDHPPLERAVGE